MLERREAGSFPYDGRTAPNHRHVLDGARRGVHGVRRKDAARVLCAAGQALARGALACAADGSARGFDEMTSVSKELRAALARHFTLARPEVVAEQVSLDGTRKWLLRLPGEHSGEALGERPHEVECVYIPEADRGTLCVSSQVGCTLTCSFCHTGTQRLVRNLGAAEIVAQVMIARDALGEWPSPQADRQLTNVVLMGMGEPLFNYDNVAEALHIVMDPEGLSISRRK